MTGQHLHSEAQLYRRFVEFAKLMNVYLAHFGLPIGNLLSQLHALVYLNPVDHHIKRTLGVQRYCRYVDDLLLLDLTRDEAFAHRDAIAAFLRTELRLELSRATIAPSRRGVNFVGYRAWASRRFVRRHALHTFRLAARAGDVQRIASCLGHARRTASHARMLRELAARH